MHEPSCQRLCQDRDIRAVKRTEQTPFVSVVAFQSLSPDFEFFLWNQYAVGRT